MKKTTVTKKVKQNAPASESNQENRLPNSTFIAYQINNFVFGLIAIFLSLRFFFKLSSANPGTWIVQFVYSVSDVLMYPFQYIFPTRQVDGSIFEWSVFAALILYSILSWAISKFLFITTTASSNS